MSTYTKNDLFKASLQSLARDARRDFIKAGTTACSSDSLWNAIIGDASRLPSAPKGTNAAWVARELFREVVAGDKLLKSFTNV